MMNFNIKTFLFLISVAFSMQGRADLKNLSDVVRDTPGSAGEKNVVILQADTVTINSASTDIGTLTIEGTLKCGSISMAEIKVKTIYVNGTFECGTAVSVS